MHKQIWILLTALILVSCGKSDTFEVSGEIDGNPTMNLRYTFYDGDALRTGITASREGKFAFKALANEPVIVELYDNDYKLLGRFYAENGDKIKCHIDADNPYKSTFVGNEVSEGLTEFTNKNAEQLYRGGAESNKLISDYVKTHTTDMVSAILAVSMYDASRDADGASALLESLDKTLRQNNIIGSYEYLLSRIGHIDTADPVMPMTIRDSRDSLITYNPRRSRQTLIVISDNRSGRSDSILPRLRELSKRYKQERLRILDFSVDADTVSWKNNIRNDSAQWLQAWGAGMLASPAINRLGVPSVPYFIVADSSGRQVYRGISLKQAIKEIN